MKHSRKSVLVLCLALLSTNYSNAQDVSATGNLVEMYNWTGVQYTNTAGVSMCCSGGPQPALNTDTNTIRFSWGYSTAAQSLAINKALQSIGTGIKVTGYNYSWKINNADYNSGPLQAKVNLMAANGNLLESYLYDFEILQHRKRYNPVYSENLHQLVLPTCHSILATL